MARTGGSGDSRHRRRILVADDDLAIQQAVVRLLSADYDIVGVAANGRELIEAAQGLKPDVMIVDVSMPEMNGFDAFRKLRADGMDAKVIFFSGNGNALYVKKAFGLGAGGYVLKEHGFDELPQAVRAVLSGDTFVSPSIHAER